MPFLTSGALRAFPCEINSQSFVTVLSNPSTSKALTSPCTTFQKKARKRTKNVEQGGNQPTARCYGGGAGRPGLCSWENNDLGKPFIRFRFLIGTITCYCTPDSWVLSKPDKVPTPWIFHLHRGRRQGGQKLSDLESPCRRWAATLGFPFPHPISGPKTSSHFCHQTLFLQVHHAGAPGDPRCLYQPPASALLPRGSVLTMPAREILLNVNP